MHLAIDELRSYQAFTVISVATPATENRVQARALIRVALRDTLAAFLGQSAETILLDSRPGKPMQVDSAWGGVHLSLSHMPGLSIAAISRVSAVGVDVMHDAMGAVEMSDWTLVAREYLGPSVSDLLHNRPHAQRKAAFAQAWTRLESCLKCMGLPLTEWNPHLAQQLPNCHVMGLDLPEGCRGSIAMPRRKLADPCVTLNSSLRELPIRL
jgi:4'-phosphopantetheinyl transferase